MVNVVVNVVVNIMVNVVVKRKAAYLGMHTSRQPFHDVIDHYSFLCFCGNYEICLSIR